MAEEEEGAASVLKGGVEERNDGRTNDQNVQAVTKEGGTGREYRIYRRRLLFVIGGRGRDYTDGSW